MAGMKRCPWVAMSSSPDYEGYHDTEWGVPCHDDNKLYEQIVLGGAQAGLNWAMILKKRENYRKAFANFDPVKVAKYDSKKIEQLLTDSGLIRNRGKIVSAVNNAKAVLKVQEEFGSLDKYLWQFVNHTPMVSSPRSIGDYPTESTESQIISKDMKKRGFSFVGPTTIYAIMQGIGMINDHTVDCHRYNTLGGSTQPKSKKAKTEAAPAIKSEEGEQEEQQQVASKGKKVKAATVKKEPNNTDAAKVPASTAQRKGRQPAKTAAVKVEPKTEDQPVKATASRKRTR